VKKTTDEGGQRISGGDICINDVIKYSMSATCVILEASSLITAIETKKSVRV